MICRNVVDHQEFQKLCKMIMNKKKTEKRKQESPKPTSSKRSKKIINHLVLILNELVLILNQLNIILNKLDAKLIPFS
jgi:hypothetical protein